MFKVNALTRAVGNGMCSGSKRKNSEDWSQALYAEIESHPPISRPYTLPLTQKKENNIRMTPTLKVYLKYKSSKLNRLRSENQHAEGVSNFSYIFFCFRSKGELVYLFVSSSKIFFSLLALLFFILLHPETPICSFIHPCSFL